MIETIAFFQFLTTIFNYFNQSVVFNYSVQLTITANFNLTSAKMLEVYLICILHMCKYNILCVLHT